MDTVAVVNKNTIKIEAIYHSMNDIDEKWKDKNLYEIIPFPKENSASYSPSLVNGIITMVQNPDSLKRILDGVWDQVRTKRNALLSSSDWTQLPDVQLTLDQKSNWSIYRQKLRDITNSSQDPSQVVWPIPPQ